MKTIEYDSNNSGGYWWLTDDNWKALENAGWTVNWRSERFLGASATSATIEAEDLDTAINSWEKAISMRAHDLGCGCCGPPHNFYERR